MNSSEKKMLELLIDLRKNHSVVGVKSEFEAEGASLEEALLLKQIVTLAELDFIIKIGGGGALKEMYEARTLGVNAIVAPMIESAYAMKKFIQSTKLAFSETERKEISFFINIETITGYNCVDEILDLEESKDLTGIVFGRADMTGSLGQSKAFVNSDMIFDMVENIAAKTQKLKKKLIVGGGVSPESLPFFRKLPKNSLSNFETRKIIFDAEKALKDECPEKGILKALEFEFLWLKNKHDAFGFIHEEDAKRLIMLENQIKNFSQMFGELCV